MEAKRCPWAKTEFEIKYHDEEWGRPLHDDKRLFQMLALEGMQAGISWNLILVKRQAFLEAFDGFDPAIVATYGDEKKQELMNNPGILRNKSKINCTITNAQAFLKVQEEFGSFDRYIWGFVDGKPIVNHFTEMSQLPASTEISERMSADLRKRGFKFVGPTICYAYMQSIGMVNDHMTWCDHYPLCGG